MLHEARAVLFAGPGQPLQYQSVPLPTPGDGEVLVRIGLATICGSDLHSFDGRRTVPCPTILGHEILGTIIAMGPNCPSVDAAGQSLAVGDRVTWSLVVACGNCFYCRRELPEKCEHVFKYGHERATPECMLSGGLATHCHLKKGTQLFRLPASLPNEVACPASCATATVAAALRHAGNLAGQAVLIQGAGMLGLTAAAWARTSGAREVMVSDPSPTRLEIARSFGAHAVFAVATDLREYVCEATQGRGVDVVLEMSGAPAAVTQGIELLRCGGRAVWLGSVFPAQVPNFVAERIVRKYLTIQGVHNYRPGDLASALDFLTANHQTFPFAAQVSRTFSLAAAETAFQHARQGSSFRVAVAE